jgi:IS30 family transposase
LKLLIDRKYNQKEIAQVLGKAESAISYELTTYTRKGRVYDPEYAELRAYQRRRNSKHQGSKVVADPATRKAVEDYLMDDQSPEMIAGAIKKHSKHLVAVSGSIIRKFLASHYGRKIEHHRNRLKRKYRRRKPGKSYMANKRMITKRPKYINDRKRIGDAEGDFIVSGKSGHGMILNVIDRKSCTPFLEKINPVSIRNVERAFLCIKKKFPEMKTLTLDNDLLFVHHKRLEQLLGVKIYFCHKGSPWEKGGNEKMNAVIRRYIPKSSDISKYTKVYIKKLEEKLQRKIMKCLNYQTPRQVLDLHRNKKNC